VADADFLPGEQLHGLSDEALGHQHPSSPSHLNVGSQPTPIGSTDNCTTVSDYATKQDPYSAYSTGIWHRVKPVDPLGMPNDAAGDQLLHAILDAGTQLDQEWQGAAAFDLYSIKRLREMYDREAQTLKWDPSAQMRTVRLLPFMSRGPSSLSTVEPLLPPTQSDPGLRGLHEIINDPTSLDDSANASVQRSTSPGKLTIRGVDIMTLKNF
jgi:hypothetical protein